MKKVKYKYISTFFKNYKNYMKKTEFAILLVSTSLRPVISIEDCIIEKDSLIPLFLPDTSSTASTKLANHFQVHGARFLKTYLVIACLRSTIVVMLYPKMFSIFTTQSFDLFLN
jgi:hypothetical protein